MMGRGELKPPSEATHNNVSVIQEVIVCGPSVRPSAQQNSLSALSLPFPSLPSLPSFPSAAVESTPLHPQIRNELIAARNLGPDSIEKKSEANTQAILQAKTQAKITLGKFGDIRSLDMSHEQNGISSYF